MRAVGVQKKLRCRKDFRDTGLIVRAEKRCAVGYDQALADVLAQRFIFAVGQDDVLRFIENNIAAHIGLGDAGVDVFARRVR